MKLTLSWLRDFAPHRGVAGRDRRSADRSGHGGGGAGARRCGHGRHRRGPGARPAAPSRCRSHPAGGCRRRRRRGPADLLRRLQHGRGRSRAPGAHRHDHGQRHGDRPAQDAGRVVQRHDLLCPRGRPRQRCRRHPDPARRARARSSPGRRARAWPATPGTSWRSTPTGPTPCRWPASPATWRPIRACRSRCRPTRCPVRGRAAADEAQCRDRRRRLVRPFRGPGAARGHHGPVPAVVDDPADPRRHAADQPRRGRLELRDARAGLSQPHLRPRHGGRSHPAGAARPGRRAADHPRRRRAHLRGGRRGDL